MLYNRITFFKNNLLIPTNIDLDKLNQQMFDYFVIKTKANINNNFNKNITQINIAFNDAIDQLTKLKPAVTEYKEQLKQITDSKKHSNYGQKIAKQLNKNIQSLVAKATNTVKEKLHYIEFNVHHKITWRNLTVIIAELQTFKTEITDIKKLRQFKAQLIEAAISFSYSFNEFFDNEINWKLFNDKYQEYTTCIYYQVQNNYQVHFITNNHHTSSTLENDDDWY